jgi:hypothetical protein
MDTKTQDVLTADLRTSLKDLFAKELEQLPAYIEGLEPKEKLDYLLKLMPFVLPKVSSVEHDTDESAHW